MMARLCGSRHPHKLWVGVRYNTWAGNPAGSIKIKMYIFSVTQLFNFSYSCCILFICFLSVIPKIDI